MTFAYSRPDLIPVPVQARILPDPEGRSRQRLITKANYPLFRAKAHEAKLKRQLVRDKARAMADAITKAEPQAIEARLQVQAVAIHEAILGVITSPGVGGHGAERVRLWLECQGKLLTQIRNGPEPSHGRKGRRPDIAPVRTMAEASNQTATDWPMPQAEAQAESVPEPIQPMPVPAPPTVQPSPEPGPSPPAPLDLGDI